jgi:3-isopropylmalate/(R)-2-methylmalate dehydratase small subunit
MEPLVKLTAVACGLPVINVDTDQIIPARFLQQPRAADYNRFLFHDMRRQADGQLAADFPLNQPGNRAARIFVGRRNFGSGSSREAAVYALTDHGARCVIAPSFGDIFASNAVNNGLLPARVSEADAETLLESVQPGGVELTVDLQSCEVSLAGRSFAFQVDPIWRLKLLNGWDDIDITLRYEADIARWLEADAHRRPWAAMPAAHART